MIQQLTTYGFTKGYFPFTKNELETLKHIASQATVLDKQQRKNIFSVFPEVRTLFQRAIDDSPLDLILSDYCFFIEKTVDQNWPLLFHRDINLPDYMNIPKDQREDFLKKCIMCRLNLDTSDETTGALKVIPGSHIDKNGEERFINTDEGEVIFFKPLLLHGSNKMTKPHTRRVFQALCIEKN